MNIVPSVYQINKHPSLNSYFSTKNDIMCDQKMIEIICLMAFYFLGNLVGYFGGVGVANERARVGYEKINDHMETIYQRSQFINEMVHNVSKIYAARMNEELQSPHLINWALRANSEDGQMLNTAMLQCELLSDKNEVYFELTGHRSPIHRQITECRQKLEDLGYTLHERQAEIRKFERLRQEQPE